MPGAATGVLCDDETLVALARNGDRPACEELFRRHQNFAYGVAYRLLGHADDALDAVQDAFTKAFTHLHDFDGRSGFRTWLTRIVQNAATDLGRKRKRRPLSGLNDAHKNGVEPAFEEDPARGLHQQDLRRQINEALQRLKPKIRSTFILYAESGLKYNEIAEIQEIPIGTVMSRISAARQKLQADLKLGEANEPGSEPEPDDRSGR
jgi:RNA polymerase sigma-70 factor (ECF subfamily)